MPRPRCTSMIVVSLLSLGGCAGDWSQNPDYKGERRALEDAKAACEGAVPPQIYRCMQNYGWIYTPITSWVP